MKKTIGIIGGISPASTIKYYEKIIDLYYKKNKDYYYPEIKIHSLDFQYFTDLENENRKKEYIEYISASVNSLEKSGVDVVIMAANSPHSVFDIVSSKAGVPMISIAEETVKNAVKHNMKKVLLTGIKYTMKAAFYAELFEKNGIQLLVPSAQEQDEINSIIFDELVLNIITDESRNRMLEIINNYTIDGVILGCTELPLLIQQEFCPVYVLDTMTLHVEAVLNHIQNNDSRSGS
ncbi:aspartate/glutamate racemase family protein [Bacillus norwichensis]|uniref:Amino acid racemase n=1 Tax=Bacillus norwichensis TaxID=2762217 RepID=A0ABR8VMV3_9BACI|nr:amino acid racemase [Bacillus norwichensis]MBD8006106.1 amino acid racemase [Bacillus norwichensis]